ncbi:hypothetical protein [Rhizomonospora bruguierae]|uniref:hypothetical protein n=1 Tax=Rhizomonospora bruguierae TaxID=1581705 RepID=UPI001BCEA4B3|nr:hypothetical protein [Micromonospora sp. NBRC 107566]
MAAGFNDPVHVVSPPSVRVSAQSRLRVHVGEMCYDEVLLHAEPPCTTAIRAAWDVARWLSPADSVPILDAMLHSGIVARADLDALLVRHNGRRGSRRCRIAFGIADEAGGHPLGSRLRALLVLADVPRPAVGYVVAYPSGLELRVEMAWPDQRVAVVYDMRQTAALTVAGWIVVHVPLERVRRDIPRVVREVRQALARRDRKMAERLWGPEWRPGGELTAAGAPGGRCSGRGTRSRAVR